MVVRDVDGQLRSFADLPAPVDADGWNPVPGRIDALTCRYHLWRYKRMAGCAGACRPPTELTVGSAGFTQFAVATWIVGVDQPGCRCRSQSRRIWT